jgi:SAM-dependent methyltransferase
MKSGLLAYLRCPACQESLRLDATQTRDAEIVEGTLSCQQCGVAYPVRRGIPRLLKPGISAEKARTARAFGWQWQHFTQTDERYAEQFLGWIAPVGPGFFKDKIVLEGGCGKGRHTRRIAGWGAQDVVAVDLSDAVEVAFAATCGLPNAHVVQADIFRLPLRRAFDYAFSVGVLHHLPDPREGFKSLVSKLKSGGHMSAWIYGAENNRWIVSLVNPVRRVTSSMNRRALFHLSKVPAAAVYLSTKLIYAPLNQSGSGKKLARHLFYNDYLNYISRFDWREQHSIVFDHLVAPTAFYISREEFEEWWRDVGAQDVVINWHNQNSWRGFGRIP